MAKIGTKLLSKHGPIKEIFYYNVEGNIFEIMEHKTKIELVKWFYR